MDKICIYLRKSRADEEIERDLGQGETLAKHRKALLKFSKEKNLNIVKIHEEIVSGESLIHRPEMLQMLQEIEEDKYNAVLCMDLQRLGRGNMQEQGLILETFKKHNTKIITLQKTYDLNNDFDEEYSEFEAFMSRKELKMINRRLQSGRVRAIQDGNYLSPLPPYGYDICKKSHSRTLSIKPDQASIVKMIFDMYVNKNFGCRIIAKELNDMGYKSYKGKAWESSTIQIMLKNQVYIGKIVWGKKDIKKSTQKNKVKDVKQRPKSEWIVADGKHPAIVSKELFDKAQEIMNKKYHIPYQVINGPRNPLAGIIICGVCGSKMVYRPYGDKPAHIICPKCCGNKSSKFEYVEDKLLKGLEIWLKDFELNIKNTTDKQDTTNIDMYTNQLNSLSAELKELKTQKLALYDLLERGVYDTDTFIERSKNITDRIEIIIKSINNVKSKIEKESSNENKQNTIPKIKNVISLYKATSDISEKNMLLKSILEKAVYKKEKAQHGDDFSLILYPKIY